MGFNSADKSARTVVKRDSSAAPAAAIAIDVAGAPVGFDEADATQHLEVPLANAHCVVAAAGIAGVQRCQADHPALGVEMDTFPS